MKHFPACLVSIFAVAISQSAPAQTPPRIPPRTPDVIEKYEQTLPSADFIRRDAMVPMRDGVKLYTTIVMKKGTANAPILFSRTPYDAHKSTHRTASQRIVDIVQRCCREQFLARSRIRWIADHAADHARAVGALFVMQREQRQRRRYRARRRSDRRRRLIRRHLTG